MHYSCAITTKGDLYRYDMKIHWDYRPGHPVFNLQKKGGAIDFDRENAFNGTAEKEINQTENRGIVRSLDGAQAIPDSHPSYLGIPATSDAKLDYFKLNGLDLTLLKVTGTAEADGRPVLQLEGPSQQIKSNKFILFIDPGRSYRVVKMITSPADGATGLTQVEEFKNLVEAEPGIWIPTLKHLVTYETSPNDDKVRVFTEMTTTLKVDTLKINQPVEDSFFDLTFPKGMKVTDEIVGRGFVKDKTLSESEMNDLKRKVEVGGPSPNPSVKPGAESKGSSEIDPLPAAAPITYADAPGPQRMWWVGLLSLAAVAILAGSIMMIRKRTRLKR